MSGRSSIDSLRRLAPVSDSDAAAVFGAAGQEELLAGVTQHAVRPPERTPRLGRRRRRFVLAAVARRAGRDRYRRDGVGDLRGSPARETHERRSV